MFPLYVYANAKWLSLLWLRLYVNVIHKPNGGKMFRSSDCIYSVWMSLSLCFFVVFFLKNCSDFVKVLAAEWEVDHMLYWKVMGGQDSLLVRGPDSWSKGCKFESWQEQQENFLLQSQVCVLTLTRCLFHPHVTAVACKRPRSFRQKCRWYVTPRHTYTVDRTKSEWADYAAVQAQYGNLSGNKLTCNLSGNIQPQLSQLTVDWSWQK